jgi:hypothetical protein
VERPSRIAVDEEHCMAIVFPRSFAYVMHAATRHRSPTGREWIN